MEYFHGILNDFLMRLSGETIFSPLPLTNPLPRSPPLSHIPNYGYTVQPDIV